MASDRGSLLEGLKHVQEALFGKGKFLLNKFSRSVSFLRNQAILLPNKRGVTYVIDFTSPEMCKGVNDDAQDFFLIVALMLALIALLPMIPSLQGVLPIQ